MSATSYCVTRWRRIITTGIISLTASTSGALAQPVLYVDQSAGGNGSGSSWANAMTHLQTALAAASGGGVTEIRMAQGTFTPDMGTLDRHASFNLVSGVTVRGGYAGLQGNDPDAWDPELFETILSGDLLGNDGSDFENYEDNSYSIVTAIETGPGTALEGLTIRGGNASGPTDRLPQPDVTGGGIWLSEGALVIGNCRLESNFAGYGGAVFAFHSMLQLQSCVSIGNRAARSGGVIYMYQPTGTVQVHHSEFTNNYAESNGSAIYNGVWYGGSPLHIEHCSFNGNYNGGAGTVTSTHSVVGEALVHHVRDCTFRDNYAAGTGAAILTAHPAVVERCEFLRNQTDLACGATTIGNTHPATRTIYRDCSFLENSAPLVGAAVCGQHADFINCVFGRNESSGGGAVIIGNQTSTTTFRNCTFSFNQGYAIRGDFSPPIAGDEVRIGNSIFWGNTPGDFREITPAINISYSNIEHGWDGPGSNNISADPLFVNPGQMNYRLSEGSPCIDAGSNDLIPDGVETDIDGQPRIIGGIVDMGAYEGEFEREDSYVEQAIEPYGFAFLTPDGGPYARFIRPGIIFLNESEASGIVRFTEYLSDPYEGAIGHRAAGATVEFESEIDGGQYVMALSIPITLEDLNGDDPSQVNLTNFESALNSWSLAVFQNHQPYPGTDSPIGPRSVTFDDEPVPMLLVPGHYGIHWQTDLNRGFAWAALDHEGFFNAGVRTCAANVSLPTDNRINLRDLFAVFDAWDQTKSYFDVNGDGVVNVEDVIIIFDSWGLCE